MTSLVKTTIHISLVVGLNLMTAGFALASEQAETDSPSANTPSNSCIFSPYLGQYDPGDTGTPENGDGAGSR